MLYWGGTTIFFFAGEKKGGFWSFVAVIVARLMLCPLRCGPSALWLVLVMLVIYEKGGVVGKEVKVTVSSVGNEWKVRKVDQNF